MTLTLLVGLGLALASCNPSGAAASSPTSGSPASLTPGVEKTPINGSVRPTATLSLAPPTNPGSATATPGALKPLVHQVAHMTMLSSTSTGPATATCPQGEVALGGGWNLPSNGGRVFAAYVNGNTFEVYVLQPSMTVSGAMARTAPQTGSAVGITVTAYVECLSGASGAVVTRRATQIDVNPTDPTVTDDKLGGFTAACGQYEIPVGFGFASGDSRAYAYLEIEASFPRTGIVPIPLWVFTVRNYDSVKHTFTEYVDCLSNIGATASYPQQSASQIIVGSTASAVASCPSGTSVAGGGFQYQRHGTGNRYLGNPYHLQATTSGWQSDVYVVTSYGLYALVSTTTAVCLNFG